MDNKKYQGWTNYATWRINLEIFDSFELEGYSRDTSELAEQLKSYVEEIVLEGEGLAADYARAFVDDVNYHEIAEELLEA